MERGNERGNEDEPRQITAYGKEPHKGDVSIMQQTTDERFDHVTMEMRDNGQCYRDLLQANAEAVSQVTNTVRWITNETEKIREK